MESTSFLDWMKKVQTIEKPEPLRSEITSWRNEEYYEGFYGYVYYMQGSIFSYGTYKLRIFYKTNQVNIVYLVIWDTTTNEACVYRTFVRDARKYHPMPGDRYG